jgi:hypothetical protein
MIRSIAHKFKPNRAWECNSRWQYTPTHFKLNVPLLNSYDTTKYIVESVNITGSDIEIYGRVIEEIKPPQNKNIDTIYTNGKTCG